jgi:hypothetical protein
MSTITLPELRVAVSFLRQAGTLVEAVVDVFRGCDANTTARLNEIVQRVRDEREYIERLIEKPANGGKGQH